MRYSITHFENKKRYSKQDKSGDVGISLGFDMLKLWTTLYSWDAHPSTWILILSARRRIRAVVIGSQWSPLGMLEESEESVLKTKARHFNLHPVCDSFQGIARSRALIASRFGKCFCHIWRFLSNVFWHPASTWSHLPGVTSLIHLSHQEIPVQQVVRHLVEI